MEKFTLEYARKVPAKGNFEPVYYNTSVGDAAKWLDEHFPNWWKLIDLTKLDMSTFHTCIIGQLFGSDYASDAAGILGIDAYNGDNVFAMSSYYFNLDTDELTGEWEIEVARRIAGLHFTMMTTDDPLLAQIEEHKKIIADLENQIKQRDEELTITLTRSQIQDILNRRIGNVREKLEAALGE